VLLQTAMAVNRFLAAARDLKLAVATCILIG
jgi:hypothetical protein